MAKRSTICVIYIPGLGDRYDRLRTLGLRLWRLQGIETVLVPMKWEGDESYEEKYSRIMQVMVRVHETGKRVVLVGESAGGSMVMRGMADSPHLLHGVLTICGKNSGASTVSPRLYKKHPAFSEAIQGADAAISRLSPDMRRAFISVHPTYDPVVPVGDTLLHGCRQVRLWAVGHFVPIVLALSVYSPVVTRTIARL